MVASGRSGWGRKHWIWVACTGDTEWVVLMVSICRGCPGVDWKPLIGGRARRGEYSFAGTRADTVTRLANNTNALIVMVSCETIIWIEFFGCLCRTATRMLLLSALRYEV